MNIKDLNKLFEYSHAVVNSFETHDDNDKVGDIMELILIEEIVDKARTRLDRNSESRNEDLDSAHKQLDQLRGQISQLIKKVDTELFKDTKKDVGESIKNSWN
jgi:hypothetical protein